MEGKNSALLISTVVLAIGLMGCQGQNPMKRQSNPAPASKYPNVSAPENQNQYVPNKTHVAPSTTSRPQTSTDQVAADAPVIKFVDLKEQITFGDSFDFKVQVEDVAAGDKSVPHLIASKADDGAAIDCNTLGYRAGKGKFEFKCKFDSNLMKDVDGLLSSGKTEKAVFAFTAINSATRVKSKVTEGSLNVKFEKVAGNKSAKSDKSDKSEKSENTEAPQAAPVINKAAKGDKAEVKKEKGA